MRRILWLKSFHGALQNVKRSDYVVIQNSAIQLYQNLVQIAQVRMAIQRSHYWGVT